MAYFRLCGLNKEVMAYFRLYNYMRSHSQVHVKFLAEWEKRTVEFLTTRVSGKDVEFEILGAVWSVLPSCHRLVSVLLCVIQAFNVLDALIHGLDESIKLLWWGRFLQQSSAKERWRTDIKRDAVYWTKKTGPRTDSCVTPQYTGTGADLHFWTVTVWVLIER